MPRFFPDPAQVAGDVVAVGEAWDVDVLLEAYSLGIFPWPDPGSPLLWYCPDPRGILDFSELRFPRNWRRLSKNIGTSKSKFKVTMNQAFSEVIRSCASVARPVGLEAVDRSGSRLASTWITPDLIAAYERLHQLGYAYSVEAWSNLEAPSGPKLAGGLYGVYLNGVLTGESMFHLEANASKVCLLVLIGRAQEAGLRWMDIQMVTPVLEQIGGRYISRERFLDLVRKAQTAPYPTNWIRY